MVRDPQSRTCPTHSVYSAYERKWENCPAAHQKRLRQSILLAFAWLPVHPPCDVSRFLEARLHIAAGLVLPVLGALPDALIIAVSGLGGSREVVAKQARAHANPAVERRLDVIAAA